MEMKQMAGPEERGIQGEITSSRLEVVVRKQREGLSTLESLLSRDE